MEDFDISELEIVEFDESPLSPPNVHDPWRTPTSVLAKNLKRPSDRSSPPSGQPGHWGIRVSGNRTEI